MKMKAEARFKLHLEDAEALKPGDEFETDDANAADLKAMGMASPLTGIAQALTTAIESARNGLTGPRRNTYRRRDLKAEGSE